jgi:DNA topoisomerase-2
MSDFQILSEREHLIRRYEMYLGSKSVDPISGIIGFKYQTKYVIPALLKLIEEIYQNSTDEAIRTNFEYGTNIEVNVKNDGLFGWYCEVIDNGRGIPINIINGTYQAELCWTRARAGSNFGDDDNRVTIGKNGIGAFAVSSLSTKFVGISGNGKEQVVVECLNGCETINTTLEKSKKRGTTVKFYPDLSFFNTNEISQDILDVIKDRLYNLAICYPELKIKFNGELLVIKDSKQLSKLVSDNAISLDSKNYNIVITNSGDDEEFRHLSYFNGIAIKNGGSHIDYIISGICEELIPLIKRKWKITVLPNQIKQHLLICFWVRSFPNPRFDSQSKERITNTNGEIKTFFDIDFSKLVKKIMLEDSIIMPMIESILRKKEAQDKRAATLALKKTQKKKIVNHIEATDKNPENAMLYITEGLCVDENREVYTVDGNKKIKDIEIGDIVLTHKHNFKRVLSKSPSLKKGIILNGQLYSNKHRLYVYNKEYDIFEFVAVENLIKGTHQLVSNKLVKNGIENNIRVIISIVDNVINTKCGMKIKFSDTHEILKLEDEKIVTSTILELIVGDTIIL